MTVTKILNIGRFLTDGVPVAPLAVFRMLFGFIMLFGIVRFWSKGWIEELYILPAFHFPYEGLEWIVSLGDGMYTLFALCAVAALFIALGFFYRISAILFFLSFTYIELIDKTTYLNHYYFVSLIALLLIFLPAHRYFSLDVKLGLSSEKLLVPRYTIAIIMFQLALVYIYAGLAKLNSDWLINAMPLKIWLPAHSDLPLIGSLMDESWLAFLFSWFSAFYDLFIVFFLLYSRTRPFAYVAVIVFHILTAILFPIGMFPYVMIVATLIYFSPAFHQKIIAYLKRFVNLSPKSFHYKKRRSLKRKWALPLITMYVVFQLVFPFRYLLYPGELFWHEQGYRFGWRVMLMEKAGAAYFFVKNNETEQQFEVRNDDFLTPLQEKMMATQPDMILQYAHYLCDFYKEKGLENISIYCKSYVTLNGRGSTSFIDESIDLCTLENSFENKYWIKAFDENISGI